MNENNVIGRPSTSNHVDIDTVYDMRMEGFHWNAIAIYFNISRQSLDRYLKKNNYNDPMIDINDTVLDEIVLQYLQGRPSGRGEVALRGHILSSGFKVSRQRIRDSISRVDPIGKAERMSKPIKRRVYKVDGPHHLWHIDGHHKLIRLISSLIVFIVYAYPCLLYIIYYNYNYCTIILTTTTLSTTIFTNYYYITYYIIYATKLLSFTILAFTILTTLILYYTTINYYLVLTTTAINYYYIIYYINYVCIVCYYIIYFYINN